MILLIVLPRKTPERLLFYEVMMRRAPNSDEYSKLYAQAKSGYVAERRLDREWKDAGINGMLFHDFTCYNAAGHSHQMDTIFVCKHFVLVVEIKNVAGRIHFRSDTNQLIRIRDDGRMEAFLSPIEQVKRHRLVLENHFLTFPDLVPVEAAVIITNPACLIEQTGGDVPIFIVNGLHSKLIELTERHKHINLNIKLLKTSLEKLYRPHTNQSWRIFNAILKGVLCLNCNEKMMSGNKGFKCLRCRSIDTKNSAVRRTLHDYRILYGPEISNRQFRDFADVTSRDTAYKILARLLPNRKGTRRNFTYIIPENIYTNSF